MGTPGDESQLFHLKNIVQNLSILIKNFSSGICVLGIFLGGGNLKTRIFLSVFFVLLNLIEVRQCRSDDIAAVDTFEFKETSFESALQKKSFARSVLWGVLQSRFSETTGELGVTSVTSYGDLLGCQILAGTSESMPTADPDPGTLYGLSAIELGATQASSGISYNVYIREDIATRSFPLAGVVVMTYGAPIPIAYKPRTFFSIERILASQGYLVYSINHIGETGEGILEIVRGTTLFGSLLRNPNVLGTDIKRPVFSDLVDESTPLFQMGSSFGGFLGLFQATYPESSTRTVFDGYLADSGISDWRGDLVWETSAGSSRKLFFDTPPMLRIPAQPSPSSWMWSVFQRLDPLNDPAAHQFLSPVFRAGLIERPILVSHGLMDDNTSPNQSVSFAKAASSAGKGDLVFQYYSKNLGHEGPRKIQEAIDWLETQFRFMDWVSLNKNTVRDVRPEKTGVSANNEEISGSALFFLRALHPNPKLQDLRCKLIYKSALAFLQGEEKDPHAFWINDRFFSYEEHRQAMIYYKLTGSRDLDEMTDASRAIFRRGLIESLPAVGGALDALMKGLGGPGPTSVKDADELLEKAFLSVIENHEGVGHAVLSQIRSLEGRQFIRSATLDY